jgi:Flp pilus assembly protein TadG
MSQGGSSRHSAEEGSVAVEAGITISVLLLLMIGSVELGRALWANNTMLLAVEEAGRYAMVHHDGAPATCSPQKPVWQCPIPSNTPLANCSAEWAQQVLTAYWASSVNVSVAEDTMSSPATITICASYLFNFLAPQLLPYGPLNLTQQLTVPLI